MINEQIFLKFNSKINFYIMPEAIQDYIYKIDKRQVVLSP